MRINCSGFEYGVSCHISRPFPLFSVLYAGGRVSNADEIFYKTRVQSLNYTSCVALSEIRFPFRLYGLRESGTYDDS